MAGKRELEMLRMEPPKAPQIMPTGLRPTFLALSDTELKVGGPPTATSHRRSPVSPRARCTAFT